MKTRLCIGLAAVLCVALALPALATEPTPENLLGDLMGQTMASIEGMIPAKGQLTVTGSATVPAVPDRARVTIGVVAEDKTVAKAQQQTNATTEAVVAALKAAGIAEDKLRTSDYSINPMYDYGSMGGSKLTGYQVYSMLQVQIDDFATIGAVIDAATAAGANQINGITFDTSAREQLYADALASAIAAAREKARGMAEAAGKQLGDLVTLSEGGGSGPVYRNYAMDMVAGKAETQIQAGSIDISADVTMTFAIQ